MLDRMMTTAQSFIDNLQLRFAKAAYLVKNLSIFGEYVEASDKDIAKNVQFMELNLVKLIALDGNGSIAVNVSLSV